ncbi:unnamed protein product [Staurois parvus]|uniref:Uncharacterized protein n=1 Tax=Staurois parvus TaxID=386267 RepID=A0ABN9ADW1_9NEOB|nr:unnamed protein product [Staurois parvus]
MSCQSTPAPVLSLCQVRPWIRLLVAMLTFICQGPGSVGGPMKCPWYLFIGFFGLGKDTWAP